MSVLRPGSFLLALLMLMGVFNSAVANDANNYSGFQYGVLDYDGTNLGVPLSFKPSTLVGRMGSFINNYLALEARVGFGLSDSTVTISRIDTTLGHEIIEQYEYDVENIFAFYLLGNIPVSNRFDIYGLVGMSSVDVETTINSTEIHMATSTEVASFNDTNSATENGLSYGLGASFKVAGKTSLNLEYMSYLDKSDLAIKLFSVGVLFNF